MKRQQTIIAIFALIILAIGATNANAQFGDFINKAKEKVEKVKQVKQEVEKTKQEIKQLGNLGGGKNTPNQKSNKQNNVETWITFSKTHTRSNEKHNFSMNAFGCGDSIFTTVNFREPVDNSGGFTVSMTVDGELALQEQMSGGSATSVNETIHIELIPADDAVVGYPKVTVTAAKTILDRLPQGSHTIQIAVSLNDNPDNVAVGEFEFTGGAGCDIKNRRKQNTQKDTTKIQDKNQQGNNTNYLDFFNNCSDGRYFTYEYPDGTSSVMYTEPGFPRTVNFPVGTKFWHGNMRQGEPFFTLGKSQYTNEMDKARSAVKINLCQ